MVKVIDDDKTAANRYFREVAKPLAADLKTWIPTETNNGVFFDYEGRKPQATITIKWQEDRYFFRLIVDGEEKMQSIDRRELAAEAERIGAELEETHTP